MLLFLIYENADRQTALHPVHCPQRLGHFPYSNTPDDINRCRCFDTDLKSVPFFHLTPSVTIPVIYIESHNLKNVARDRQFYKLRVK